MRGAVAEGREAGGGVDNHQPCHADGRSRGEKRVKKAHGLGGSRGVRRRQQQSPEKNQAGKTGDKKAEGGKSETKTDKPAK